MAYSLHWGTKQGTYMLKQSTTANTFPWWFHDGALRNPAARDVGQKEERGCTKEKGRRGSGWISFTSLISLQFSDQQLEYHHQFLCPVTCLFDQPLSHTQSFFFSTRWNRHKEKRNYGHDALSQHRICSLSLLETTDSTSNHEGLLGQWCHQLGNSSEALRLYLAEEDVVNLRAAPERRLAGLSDPCNHLGCMCLIRRYKFRAGFLTSSSPEKEAHQEGGGRNSSRDHRQGNMGDREAGVAGKSWTPVGGQCAGVCSDQGRYRLTLFDSI
ncbi:hypothetical protein L1887_39099 [Cichorium endivia]|nr:hypothetical protein L1887_39099 [Cichorium endivia]